ncbi:hypothetical protein [Arsenicibacter rosenii]|uniref:Uncharacterized protein n=1 Tax=Arsenicibacter rosenii TaxID=1750698 RepID=A0A1S2VMY3_9BACT|nr:hypothetical protein [Arsenicibacter rosenii]OIN60114.1 hypothetical protein BLX24_04515 [Arsenicibacter rosenii]
MKDINEPFPFDRAGRQFKISEVRPRIDQYQKEFPDRATRINAEAFSKEVFDQIFSNESCRGIRIYYGRNEGKPSLILVGIDKHGNDIHRVPDGLKDMPGDDDSGTYGDGMPCPTHCSGGQ